SNFLLLEYELLKCRFTVNHSHSILRVIAYELLEVTSHQEHLSLNHVSYSSSDFYPTSLMRLRNFCAFDRSVGCVVERSRALSGAARAEVNRTAINVLTCHQDVCVRLM